MKFTNSQRTPKLYMEVSWNGGTPSHHRFYFRIVHHKPSSYWVPPILGNLHILYWLVVWIIFYFSIYWECHHPNWRSHIFQRGRAQPPTRWYLRVTQPFDHLRKLAAGLCWKFGCQDEATRWKKSLWSLLNRLSFEMEWHDVETYVSCGRKLSLDPDIQSWSILFFWILWPIWDPKIPKIIMIVSLCIVLTRYFRTGIPKFD